MTMWHGFVEAELPRVAPASPEGVVISATIPAGPPTGGATVPVRRRPDPVSSSSTARKIRRGLGGTDPPGTKFTGAGPPTRCGRNGDEARVVATHVRMAGRAALPQWRSRIPLAPCEGDHVRGGGLAPGGPKPGSRVRLRPGRPPRSRLRARSRGRRASTWAPVGCCAIGSASQRSTFTRVGIRALARQRPSRRRASASHAVADGVARRRD